MPSLAASRQTKMSAPPNAVRCRELCISTANPDFSGKEAQFMSTPHAILVVDLAFGDCGKGTIIDYLTRLRNAHTVVRFNGGPQAAHNVVTPDGRHHTFAQFGSGSFVPGVRTLLSRFVMIEPYAMLNEAAHLADMGVHDAMGRLLIDERCPIITPAHQAANRLREMARGDRAHGTCGMGIGETMTDLLDRPALMLHAHDLADRAKVVRKLREICELKASELQPVMDAVSDHPRGRQEARTLLDPSWIPVAADTYAAVAELANVIDAKQARHILCADGTILFEGAQGVLLDEWFGFHPHTTWSTTTFANADSLLDEAGYSGRRTRVGVLRAYFTRHGAGPLVTEDSAFSAALPEPHNGNAGWQGRFRAGPFDAVAARYALGVAGPVDSLAITHLDRLAPIPAKICTAYELALPLSDSAVAEGKQMFTWESGRIIDIPVRRPADLGASEQLTRALGRCQPVYSTLHPDNSRSFIKFIEKELQSRIGITSHGMTANDKKLPCPDLL